MVARQRERKQGPGVRTLSVATAPRGNNENMTSTDDTLDLVSARFADLVAAERAARWLDELDNEFRQATDERGVAERLVRFAVERCGEGVLYWAPADSRNEGLQWGATRASRPAPGPVAWHGERWLEAAPLVGPEWGSGLALGARGVLLALLALRHEPANPFLRTLLEGACRRALPALELLRTRHTLDATTRVLRRQRQQLHKQSRLLNLMEDWTQVLTRLEDRFQHLEALLATTVAALGGEKGSLMLLDEQSGELVVRAVCGLDPAVQDAIRRGEQQCRRLKLGEGVAGQVAQSLKPMLVNEVDGHPLFLEPRLSQVTSIVCLPLHVDGLTLGVLNVTNKLSGRRFQAEHLEDGLRLASQVSHAINNSRLYQLAILDPVADVYTRAHLYQRAGDETLRAKRYQRKLSLLAIKLEGLPDDHEAANRLEIEFANLMLTHTRETDVVARLGPRSFGVLLPETDALSAMFAAERMCQSSKESDALRAAGVVAYAGVCSLPDRADSAAGLIARAELAMQRAVRDGEALPVYLAPESLAV